ncbi:MAG: symmetrical bis(5'-nucleosyl)-tetraphosphatase [Sulfuricella sp.]|nr:symmetrical bis(5'-nucleosyl)-tetraphosphatase [Sulfuricella sp.]
MSTYAIGDIQGCFQGLQLLLREIDFDPGRDRLWLVGDLLNRGPDSLAVLRWARDLGDRAVVVLGNHDLHFLAVAYGFVKPHRKDTLDALLVAPDREELCDWLRRQHLFYAEGEYALVHAGLLPQWTVKKAAALAGEVEEELGGKHYLDFFERMYGNEPIAWSKELRGMARLRLITNAMTRLRCCTPEGEMEFSHKGPPEICPPGYVPWYEAPNRKSHDATIIFGHWSALGLAVRSNLIALDTGCLWGGYLTAVRLEDRQVFQVSCKALPSSTRWQ